MKKLISLLPTAALLVTSTAASASVYEGKCLYADVENASNEFHTCIISIRSTSLGITFKRNKFQDGNREIVGSNISQVASGNYAKRLLSDTGSVIGGVLFAPIGIASRLFNKDFQEYVLDYTSQGQQTATVVRVTPQDAPQFQQELRALALDLAVTFEDPQRSTVIDAGPDL